MQDLIVHLLMRKNEMPCGEKFEEDMLLDGSITFLYDAVTCSICRCYIEAITNPNLYKLHQVIIKRSRDGYEQERV